LKKPQQQQSASLVTALVNNEPLFSYYEEPLQNFQQLAAPIAAPVKSRLSTHELNIRQMMIAEQNKELSMGELRKLMMTEQNNELSIFLFGTDTDSLSTFKD